jgi:hypothetical protein
MSYDTIRIIEEECKLKDEIIRVRHSSLGTEPHLVNYVVYSDVVVWLFGDRTISLVSRNASRLSQRLAS